MSQPGTQQRNRRIASRQKPKGSTKVTCHKGLLGLGPNLAVSLLDLSETGVRLVVKSALEKGQEIEIGLLGLNHPRPIKLPAVVAWSVPAADGTYCLGARFQKRLTYGDFLQLAVR